MVRAGFIQQVAAGIFNYLPLGWRSIQKIRKILAEEMENAGVQEVNMPVIQPKDLWELSGRANNFVPPLASFVDRRGRTMVIAATHEESATFMAKSVISSYRHLPALIYHIQTKFRDETRPRAGLLRVREFEMKDAYSFDIDEEGLDQSFKLMEQAYTRIFNRCEIQIVVADADSGPIGGKTSKEFLLLAESGEDLVVMCNNCKYAANIEKAQFKKIASKPEEPLPIETFQTPGLSTISDLADKNGIPQSKTLKTVLYYSEKSGLILAVIRGDYTISETKLKNAIKDDISMATQEQIANLGIGIVAGYASPIGITKNIMVVADNSLVDANNLIAGANQKDMHIRNANFKRDFTADIVTDIAEVKDGYQCTRCSDKLTLRRGIEVGHIFKLGIQYSKALGLSVTDVNGLQKYPLMGSYGIGLGRLLAAAIEVNHDSQGITLPKSIAPFSVSLIGITLKDPEVKDITNKIYTGLTENGIDTIFDDREENPGVKFGDADLIGAPLRVVVSSRNLKNSDIEVKVRKTGNIHIFKQYQAVERIIELLS